MSFLLSLLNWTICLSQVIWTPTEIDVPVFDHLESYITIPEATLYVNGVAVSDIPSYVRTGVNRTFLSTVVTSYVKTYYIYFEAYFEQYDISSKQLITIRVIDDIDPVITYIPTYTIDVYGDPPDFKKNLKYSDNYDQIEDLDIIVDDKLINFNQVAMYDVIYYIIDQSGNVNEYTRQISIVDRIAPTIEVIKPVILNVYSTLNIDDFFEIKDNYDKNINTHIIGDEVGFDSLGFYEITVVALDLSKNVTQETFVVEVVDMTAPTLILVSYPAPLSVYSTFDIDVCYQYILSIHDNYDVLDIHDIQIVHDVDINRVGTYKIYYEIMDNSENVTSKILDIEVKDMTSPTIEFIEPLIFDVFSNTPILSQLFTVYDNYCESSFIDIEPSVKLNMDLIGIYEFSVIATDCYDNKTVSTALIYIIDTIPPEIIQVSDIVITDFTEKDLRIYFNAMDAYDLDNTEMIIDDQHVNYEQIGSYEITCYAYDQSHNEAIYKTEVLVVDISPPTIELTESKITVSLYQSNIDFYEYIHKISDNYQAFIIDDVMIVNEVNFNQLGRYDVYYKVIDSSYNQATALLEVFVVDHIPPSIEGDNLYVNMYESVHLMEGIEVNDNVEIYEVYTSIDYIDTTYPGSYEVLYIAVDTSGNQTTFSRMIYINEIKESFTVEDFIPIIIIFFISTSILYYLYKKL